jgi:pullulanase
MEEMLKKCISSYFLPPSQSINYISCHDNLTLWDKIDLSCKNDSFEDKKSMLKLCASIILTSQGIPFIYSGDEFCRTKNGEQNSYNKPDNINWLDWDRKFYFMDVMYFYQKLINIRKSHPAFRMITIKDIEKNLTFVKNTPSNTVAFVIKNHANNDPWKEILVIFNANKDNVNINIPEGPWTTALDSSLDNNSSIVEGTAMLVNRISSCILFKL